MYSLFSRSPIKNIGWAFPFAVIFAAPIAVLIIVRTFVVNVPFLDEWQWTPTILQFQQGTLHWPDLFWLHNEQRITVPTIMALLLSSKPHTWVITRETTFSVALVFATLAIWRYVCLLIIPKSRQPWALAAIALLACSLTQAENWVWGFQMSFFFGNLCAAAIALSFLQAQRRWFFVIGLVAMLVYSYSIGFGLTATVSGLVFYSLTRSRYKLTVWAIVSVAVVALFYRDYQASLYQASSGPLLERLANIVLFALVALGSPIARSAGVVASASFGCIAVVVIALYAWRVLRFQSRSKASLAIIAIAVMPILGAFETAFGRLFEGIPAALGGRFTTPTSVLWIVIVFVVARTDLPFRTLALAIVPLSFWASSQIYGFGEIRDRSLSLFAAAQVIPRWDDATEDEFAPLWPAEAEFSLLRAAREYPFIPE